MIFTGFQSSANPYFIHPKFEPRPNPASKREVQLFDPVIWRPMPFKKEKHLQVNTGDPIPISSSTPRSSVVFGPAVVLQPGMTVRRWKDKKKQMPETVIVDAVPKLKENCTPKTIRAITASNKEVLDKLSNGEGGVITIVAPKPGVVDTFGGVTLPFVLSTVVDGTESVFDQFKMKKMTKQNMSDMILDGAPNAIRNINDIVAVASTVVASALWLMQAGADVPESQRAQLQAAMIKNCGKFVGVHPGMVPGSSPGKQ